MFFKMDMNDCVHLLIEMIQERDSSGKKRIPGGTKCVSRLAEIGGVGLTTQIQEHVFQNYRREERACAYLVSLMLKWMLI